MYLFCGCSGEPRSGQERRDRANAQRRASGGRVAPAL